MTTDPKTLLTQDEIRQAITRATAAGDEETATILSSCLAFMQEAVPILHGMVEFAGALREEGTAKIASAAEIVRVVGRILPPPSPQPE